jgi:hypothetical protein
MQTEVVNEQPLKLGKEYPGPNEIKVVNDIVKMLKAQMLREYPPGKGLQRRQVHAKVNGCVKAEFIVKPDLPQELRVGLFREAKSYPAWIRFSNGNTHLHKDGKKDFRGFAIKVMNVPGKKLDLNHSEITSHDFIMMNNKTFFVRDVHEFAKILYIVTTPHTLASFPKKFVIGISNIPFLIRATEAKTKIRHPAEVPYFSTTPYRFGDESRAVKYGVFPSAKNQLLYPDTSSKDFLHVNMAATLKEHALEYDFCIQFQTDPHKMPIEDPSVEWTSEYIKLATIRIPVQTIDTAERIEMGEHLSFNTWHALPEHRPLGVINRVRKFIYEEMYDFRHKHNNIEDKEPEAGPDFFNDTK